MKHRASSKFWDAYEELPEAVRELADKSYVLLKSDSRHPSLHFKKIGRLWSVRVGEKYRALGVDQEPDGILWFWIGTHAAYDTLIRRAR